MGQVTTVPCVGQGYNKFIYITEISSANLITKSVNGFVLKKQQRPNIVPKKWISTEAVLFIS